MSALTERYVSPDEIGQFAIAKRHALRFKDSLHGYEFEDVLQEALYALEVARGRYKPGPHNTANFSTFADRVIRYHLAKLWRSQTRAKRPVLVPVEDVRQDVYDPDVALILDAKDSLAKLSDTQRRCVLGVACGYSYAELGGAGRAGFNFVNNAVQQGRRALAVAAA